MSGEPRRRSWLLRVLSWPVSLVLIVATVAVGDQIIQHTPGSDEVSRPFIHSGRIGDIVDGLTFTAKVHSVRGGRSVTDTDGDVYTTDGLFVLVTITVTATTDTTRLDHLAVAGGGRTYRATRRFDQDLDLQELQPGIGVKGELVFEVPPTGALDLALQLGNDQVLTGEFDNETLAQIDLAIDQAHVTTWLAESDSLVLTTPELT